MADKSDKLDKVFSALKMEIQSRQTELGELLKKDCDKVQNCGLRSKETGCDCCVRKEECRKESLMVSAKLDILEKEISRMLLMILAFLLKRQMKQQGDSQN